MIPLMRLLKHQFYYSQANTLSLTDKINEGLNKTLAQTILLVVGICFFHVILKTKNNN